MMHRHEGSVWYSGYCPDTTVEIGLKTPLGAPLLFANETYLSENMALYHFPRAWRHECRVFVQQESTGTLHAIEAISTAMGVERRIQVNGLKNAVVYVLPKNGDPERTYLLLNSHYPHFVGEPLCQTVEDTVFGPALRVENVSGTLLIMDKGEDYDVYNR